ncbi:MAG: ATP-binding cassette domain-containing protein [Clostridia bacterium]|nr:ATP-binding cassette domain-containing protein [Clostridia bacterium]
MVFEGVTKCFGGRPIIEDFNLTLPPEGTLCLFGPSGCGKTTILHLLAGIHTPDAGRISGLRGRIVSAVFQEPRLLPWLSALHNVSAVLPLPQDGRDGRERTALEWLDRVGLAADADKLPDELSGGMRQRVAIARALAYGGDLLLLDEPTQGLDSALRTSMIRLFRETSRHRLTLLVTHDSDEAESMGSTVLTLSGPPVRVVV